MGHWRKIGQLSSILSRVKSSLSYHEPSLPCKNFPGIELFLQNKENGFGIA